MGTRGTVKFYCKSGDDKDYYGGIYRQYDSYPEGLGLVLKTLLATKEFCNGISHDYSNDDHFNGIGCLGAYVIKELKEKIGGIYLTTEDDTQAYDYEIYQIWGDPVIYIKIDNYDGPIGKYNPV